MGWLLCFDCINGVAWRMCAIEKQITFLQRTSETLVCISVKLWGRQSSHSFSFSSLSVPPSFCFFLRRSTGRRYLATERTAFRRGRNHRWESLVSTHLHWNAVLVFGDLWKFPNDCNTHRLVSALTEAPWIKPLCIHCEFPLTHM